MEGEEVFPYPLLHQMFTWRMELRVAPLGTGITSIAPDDALRRKVISDLPASLMAFMLSLPTSMGLPSPLVSNIPSFVFFHSITSTGVLPVNTRPAAMQTLFPKGIPHSAIAPIRQFSPVEILVVLPPDKVPRNPAPAPTSVPAPMVVPADIRPSTMDAPSVPALKFTNP
ncbi:MAG: hypothetical protein ACD_4C00306G0003 [uncultured bacterium (gcode 4)]|uniref:Uncharacterized protein n=1 Tax=uncultured bacterium (gcode 4) TaxID=1234023 RepID=K2FWY0_9BACT|nr:MAG: hypothetical protein ACD_4C00306G0003 [uncultured bacterium (gcode 4)]